MESFEKKKAIVGDKEYDIPEGIEQITSDGIFLVDFEKIEIANNLEEEFFNPRHLGSFDYEDGSGNKKKFLGQGFDKESMMELLADVAKNGMNYPLLTRWVYTTSKDVNGEIIKDENDQPRMSIKVQVYDGERRYRCIDRLCDSGEKAWDESKQRFGDAKEVYAKVACRIRPMSDEEAMGRACAVTETSVEWGDAAVARLIKKELERGKTEEQICKLLNRGKQYVEETNALNTLDDFCFNYLLMKKINREVAKKLLKITDIAVRQQKCVDAYEDAVVNHSQTLEKVDQAVEKAEVKEELALAELEEAKLMNEPTEVLVELEEKAKDAEEKTKQRKQNKAASAQPMAKSKNLRRVGAGGHRPVTSAKVSKHLKVLRELVDKGDETYGSTSSIKSIIAVLEALLKGEDICDAIKKAS